MINFRHLLLFFIVPISLYSQSTKPEQSGNWEDPNHWATTIAGTLSGNILSLNNKSVIINGTTIAERDLYLSNTNVIINPQDTLVIKGYFYLDNFSNVQNNGTLIVIGDVYTTWFSSINNNGKFVSTENVYGWNWGSDFSGESYVYGSRNGVNPIGEEGNENDLQNNDPELYDYVEDMIAILPVELISFDISTFDNEIYLEWKTANEKNNDYFEILRSNNAMDWKTIGKISGNGTTNSIIHYSFEDHPSESGVYYYRIKQVDYNGDYEKFHIKRIEYNTKSVEIFPNPFVDKLIIHSDFEEILVYDELGRTRFKSENKNTGSYQIDTFEWEKGIYMVKIVTAGGIKSFKVIK
ncbi:T9SS type A sorting domain-containing protein [Mangrovivirga sp. M17]|uniref:T9SS type A sorting domain-containing protein n=1 Tax=Mangrovivirga halotolerans TaxID=2993936 RepID=A0ABT3RRN0_9BACT|nr:T9SS type A sorting domain-containing protein [Mangrovivirga halotolerans]MCX2744028.1 T9SS type A sorting domain-containing protein [Mangrovivirga halotolerans]